MDSASPLAYRLRPKTFDDFRGQEKVVGPNTPLRLAIERDQLRSVILSGPPGTGKTTLAHIIAAKTNAHFTSVNAILSGVKELKEICADAQRSLQSLKQRTVLFIDEIHRFNKAQQDALLPYVENGSVILVGATTENPYFEVNAALVSRSHVLLLQPLSEEDLVAILRRALSDPEGFGGKISVEDKALEHIARISNGDARIALNALELAAMTAGGRVSAEKAVALFGKRSHRYGKKGEDHYDTISAFIKSLRGSDADAALVWLFKMIESGEEPRFLFRRMLIFASEDVGNADPEALRLTVSCWQAFEMVGLPEGEFFLAHACIYLATAPKSNAVTRAMGAVKRFIQNAAGLEVPLHLRNAPVKGMKEHGYGKGYLYPHDVSRGVVPGDYFPMGTVPQDFYEPTDRGGECDIRCRMEQAKQIIRSGV
jgi:putative ATPase